MKKLILIFGWILLVGCNKTDHCDWDIYKIYPDIVFLECGSIGLSDSPDIHYEAMLNINPKDWDRNIYFTGKGWMQDRPNAYVAKDTCELKNKICWAFRWDKSSKYKQQTTEIVEIFPHHSLMLIYKDDTIHKDESLIIAYFTSYDTIYVKKGDDARIIPGISGRGELKAGADLTVVNYYTNEIINGCTIRSSSPFWAKISPTFKDSVNWLFEQ